MTPKCQCTHSKTAHATDFKGRCVIVGCKCKKFKPSRARLRPVESEMANDEEKIRWPMNTLLSRAYRGVATKEEIEIICKSCEEECDEETGLRPE